MVSIVFLTHGRFIEPKAEKQKIQCLVTKRGKKFNPTRFSEPWPKYCGWFHLLFLVMAILSSQKLKKAKYRFWLQKGVKSSIRYNFLIRNPEIVGSFICYFWFMAILSSQKFKNAKYRFWLQKGIKNWIRQDFLIRGLKLYVVSLLLLSQNLFHEWMNSMDLIFSLITLRRIFWDETSFSFTFHAEKVSNEKLQFQVTKRDKKLYEQLFWTHHQKLRAV